VLSLHLLRQDVIGAIRNSECTSCLSPGFTVTGFYRERSFKMGRRQRFSYSDSQASMRKLLVVLRGTGGRWGKITERQVLERDMDSNRNALSKKIETLSAEQIAEVEDFVEFLRHRGQDRELARAAATASSPALEAIWNNPEDDVYDAV
jgi:hypothetical protein